MTQITIKRFVTVLLVSIGLSTTLLSADTGASVGRWFELTLKQGETDGGYRWTVGVKGRQAERLTAICTAASMVEPLRDEVHPPEGESVTDCGPMRRPLESVSSTVAFERGASGVTVLVAVYRPVVRQVTVMLATGERKHYPALNPHIRGRDEKGIPAFRYIAMAFEESTCVRRIVTRDGKGRVIAANDFGSSCSRGDM